MKLGWIDFSSKDRKRAIDVIHMIGGHGAVDELGIGIVRDAFANMFFPGTSTVQTRAKYFIIIPYIIKECCDNKWNSTIEAVKKMIDDREKECAMFMKSHGEYDGVIGADIIPERWVVRRPYSIYWNGIKQLGLFTKSFMSLDEYIRDRLIHRSEKTSSNWSESGEENSQDDKYAGDIHKDPFWNLPSDYNTNWKENLSIELTEVEAEHLKNCIMTLDGTLSKYVLISNLDLGKYFADNNQWFRLLYEDIKDKVDEKLRMKMDFAVKFDSLVYLCRILYNKILSDDENVEAEEEWNSCSSKLIDEVSRLNLDDMFVLTGTTDNRVRVFLKDMQGYLVNSDFQSARNCIIKREINLKGRERAKLVNKNSYDKNKWIGGHHLDFRMYVTSRLMKDIYREKGGENV